MSLTYLSEREAYGPKLPASAAWALTVMLAIVPIRGIIVLNSPVSATTVYGSTAAAMVCLACYGFATSRLYRESSVVLFRELLAINLVLGLLNVAIDLILSVSVDASLFYFFLAPYSIFLFLRLPPRYLHVAFVVIACGIGYSVLDNFISALQGPAVMLAYIGRLRPELAVGLSRTGDFYRAAGYTGSHHDSANILGMLLSYFIVRHSLRAQLIDLLVGLLCLLTIAMTQSAANIVVAFSTTLLFLSYLLISGRSARLLLNTLTGVIAVAILGVMYSDVLTVFLVRVGDSGDWSGIATGLDQASLISSIPSLFVGHATGFGGESSDTEFAVLKIVLHLGIVHALVLLTILAWPLFRFMKQRVRSQDALPSLAAVTCGVASLVHYGSLLRVTSVFVFYSLAALCIGTMLRDDEDKKSASLRNGRVVV